MPALKPSQTPERYAALSAALDLAGHKNFCGPLALALLAGVGWQEAIETCKAHGYTSESGMATNSLILAFRQHFFQCELLPDEKIILQYPKGHRDVLKNITTHHPRRFPKPFEGLNLLMVVKGHFVAVCDGQVQCYAVNNSLRCLMLYSVSRIEEKPSIPLPKGMA